MKPFYVVRPSVFCFAIAFVLLSLFSSQARAQAADADNEILSQPVQLPPDVGLYHDLQHVPASMLKSAPFARLLDEMVKRAGVTGTFDQEARIRSFEQSQQDLLRDAVAEKAGTLKPLANAWTNIGLKGDGNASSPSNRVFSGGCITAIAIDPTNSSVIYAGATSGGVWKTSNGGTNWTPLTDNYLPNLSVSSISIDPNHTSIIYVGTGNSYSSVDELTGSGIWRSTDAGGTWNRIGASTFSGSVVKVLVDPGKSNVILASAYSGARGLYRSADSGTTWTKVYPSGAASGVVWDVEPAATINGTTIMYMVEGNNIGGTATECGVYKSVNDGSTWTKLTSAALPSGSRIGRSALAIPAGATNRVFVFMANNNGDTLGLFRSVDNGATWGSIGIPGTVMNPNNQGAQGWYDVYLGVTRYSNTNHDTIYIGGVEGWVNYSDASGWTQYAGYFDQGIAIYPHVDQHTIAFDPFDPSRVFIGSDGGLYLSEDAAGSWKYLSNTMVTNRVYHIGFDKNDSRITWGGLQDQGTWKITNGAPVSASLKFGGDGFQPIVDPTNSSTVYAQLPQGKIYRSYNAFGSSSSDVSPSDNTNRNWDTPFKMGIAKLGNINANNLLYIAYMVLLRSTDQGGSWSAISPDFSGNGDQSYTISAIGLSRNDSWNIYCGLNNGHIEFTSNGGTSWTSRSTGLPGARVTSIGTSSKDSNFVLASFNSYGGSSRVEMSTNKGTSWTNVSGGTGSALPIVGTHCIAIDSVNPLTTWYVATDNGIYYTRDAGAHWSVAGSGLGLAPCTDVQIHPNGTTIRVATFGRGVWEANTGVLPVELSSLTYQKTSRGTQLSWHTDSERGDAGFYVERSVNGDAFQDITFIAGNGTTDIRHDYAALDTMRSAGTYLYQLKQVDLNGTFKYSNHVEVHYGNDQMIVYQNYPNPLLLGGSVGPISPLGDVTGILPAAQTRFRYELPADDVVTLKIYNSSGALVKTLLQDDPETAGEQDAFWDARDNFGQIVSSGGYFYAIESQHYGKFTGKMVLLHN